MSSLDSTLTEYWRRLQLDGRSALLLEYTPILGPLFTSGTALRALFDSFTGDKSGQQSTDESTSKLIRVKGLSAITSGLADICLVCFCLLVMAFAGDQLGRLTGSAFVHQSVLGVIVLNCLAVSIGVKLVSAQVIEFSTSQLEQVQTVGSSVVKSASITASAIEKIVTSTNNRTQTAIGAFDAFVNRCMEILAAILALPANTKLRAVRLIQRQYRGLIDLFKLFLGALFITRAKSVD